MSIRLIRNLAANLLLGFASFWAITAWHGRSVIATSRQNSPPNSLEGATPADQAVQEARGNAVTRNPPAVENTSSATSERVEPRILNSNGSLERSRPRLIASVPATFPWQASAEGLTDGWVNVSFTVRTDGGVENVLLQEASFWAFETPAVAAVEKYLYEPAIQDGRPVATGMTVRVDFSVFEPYPDPPNFLDRDQPNRAMVPIVKVTPIYPESAAELGIVSGHVVVELTVNVTGGVESVSVVESSSPLFEASALNSAAKWKYQPKRVNGEEVAVDGIRARIDFAAP